MIVQSSKVRRIHFSVYLDSFSPSSALLAAFIAEYQAENPDHRIDARLDVNRFFAATYTESRQIEAVAYRHRLAAQLIKKVLPRRDGFGYQAIVIDGAHDPFTEKTGAEGPRMAGPMTKSIRGVLDSRRDIDPRYWLQNEHLTSRTCPACGASFSAFSLSTLTDSFLNLHSVVAGDP